MSDHETPSDYRGRAERVRREDPARYLLNKLVVTLHNHGVDWVEGRQGESHRGSPWKTCPHSLCAEARRIGVGPVKPGVKP